MRRSRGQALVLLALALVALCGMLALAVDAGRLYFQRRLMQDAVDAGALAGAQDLVGTVANPSGQPNYALFHAVEDTLSVFKLTPTYTDPTVAPYNPAPPGNTVTDSKGGYTVTVVAPTGYNNKQVQVTVSSSAVATFAQIIGFNQISIQAGATAEAGTNAKTYAVFAYGGIGTGNTINAQLAGYSQVDNGQDGSDACNLSGAGVSVSNAKFHIPAGTTGILNINGRLVINVGSDNANLAQFWAGTPPFGTGQDPKPNYTPPDVVNLNPPLPLNPSRYRILKIPALTGTATVPGAPGVVLHNYTPLAHDFIVFYPGHYTTPIAIPAVGDDLDSRYIFLNGIYWFSTGGTLAITGGTISNTSTGAPHYVSGQGATDLPPDVYGTDGVEFFLDGTSAFTAANTALIASSVFFVAPNFVPSGNAHVAFFVAPTSIAPLSWTDQNFNATTSNVPIFQVWGTVFDGSGGAGSIYLRAVQLGPHNLSPTDSDPSGQYAVNGELIGFTMTIDAGSIFGTAAGSPPDCTTGSPNWTGHQGKPGLLVQYNKNFVPTPGANSYLIK